MTAIAVDESPALVDAHSERRRAPRLPLEAKVGLGILAVMLLAGFLVPVLSPYDVARGTGSPPNEAPSADHWFGTDHLGRDVFVRAFAAVRIDLGIALLGVSVPLVLGTIIGASLGTTTSKLFRYVGDLVIESINAFPGLIVVIGLAAVLGRGAMGILVGIYITSWARYAKVSRGRALSLREMDYLEVAKGLGYSRRRILLRHVTPNVSPITLSYAISDFVVIVLVVAALSFLGVGVQPPTAEWGAMMSDGRVYLVLAWWPVIFPGVLLTITAVAIALIAEGVTDGTRASTAA
jgi:peptide/nickel transport system permease protein